MHAYIVDRNAHDDDVLSIGVTSDLDAGLCSSGPTQMKESSSNVQPVTPSGPNFEINFETTLKSQTLSTNESHFNF